MENLEIYNKVRAVPDNAQRKITGGRLSGKTDINPMWRIRTLTEIFGPCGIGWYYRTTNKWLERHGEYCAAFVDIELFVKVEGEWSMPICGTGGSMFAEQERQGIHVSDECYKMAVTDAISVACKQLGIGADIYWSGGTKYSSQPSKPAEDSDSTKWCCESCKKPFEPIIFKGKKYTPEEVYRNRKNHSDNGMALCKDCTKNIGA